MSEPTASIFITRLITSAAQHDPVGIHAAISDAEAAGIHPTILIVAMAGTLEGLLADRGYTLQDLQRLLLAEEAAS